MVEAAGDAQADRLQRSALDVDGGQDRARVKSARERQAKVGRVCRLTIDRAAEGVANRLDPVGRSCVLVLVRESAPGDSG
jgi:hypothetical protein